MKIRNDRTTGKKQLEEEKVKLEARIRFEPENRDKLQKELAGLNKVIMLQEKADLMSDAIRRSERMSPLLSITPIGGILNKGA